MFGKDIFLKDLSSHQRIGLHVFIYQPRRPIRDHGSKDDSSFMVARSAADGHVQGANVQFVQLRNGLGCGCGTDLQTVTQRRSKAYQRRLTLCSLFSGYSRNWASTFREVIHLPFLSTHKSFS